MEQFFEDFNRIWNLIENNENFAYARYADGEVLLMRGLGVSNNTQAYQMDRWNAPNKLTLVGKELLETISHTENNYFYAISGKNDNINDYRFLMDNIKQEEKFITFANLWINANYQRMMEKYNNLKRDVVLICNEKAQKENFPFDVVDIHPFPNDCVNFWEENSDEYIKNIINMYGEMENQLFFISCGPVSEIIIHKLYINNPNNTYMDVGSSIDEFVHKTKTRLYMIPNNIYSNFISNF